MPYTQWQKLEDGAGYVAAGRTVKKITPGIYDLAIIQGTLYWSTVANRTEEIIRFPDTPVDEVVGEIEKFWELGPSFAAHGLPHKRGILLYGPPGSGKTCTLSLVTRDVIERGGVVVIFRSAGSFTLAYRQLRMIQPMTPLVVLMEDIDELLDRPNKSDILNLLDGIEGTERTVFLATTNFPRSPNLGPRVINRPSRFDRRFRVGHPGPEARRMYLESISIGVDDFDIERYARDSHGMSLAHLKELFVGTVLLGTDYGKTLKALRDMCESVNDSDDPDGAFGTYI